MSCGGLCSSLACVRRLRLDRQPAVGGHVFTTELKFSGPDNVQIIPGTNITAQITAPGPLFDPSSDSFSIDGNSVRGDTPVGVAGGTALDVAGVLDQSSPGLDYYDLTCRSPAFSAGDNPDSFRFSISSRDDPAITSFDQDSEATTLMGRFAQPLRLGRVQCLRGPRGHSGAERACGSGAPPGARRTMRRRPPQE